MIDDYIVIDTKQAKEKFCDVHECSVCPFFNGANCTKDFMNFLESLSVKSVAEKEIDKAEIVTLAKQIKDDTEFVTNAEFSEIVDRIHKEIDNARKDSENEIVMARIFLCANTDMRIPVGQFKYETLADQIRCVRKAREYAKQFDLKYCIEPIKRKDVVL